MSIIRVAHSEDYLHASACHHAHVHNALSNTESGTASCVKLPNHSHLFMWQSWRIALRAAISDLDLLTHQQNVPQPAASCYSLCLYS